MVGLSGVMEFPLVSSGISELSYLGDAGVALDDDRLVTLNQTAPGVFAHIWKVPTGLMKEAGPIWAAHRNEALGLTA
jgi:hypothetical protein